MLGNKQHSGKETPRCFFISEGGREEPGLPDIPGDAGPVDLHCFLQHRVYRRLTSEALDDCRDDRSLGAECRQVGRFRRRLQLN